MSVNAAYFAGVVAGILLMSGLQCLQRRQPTLGFGLWIGVLLLTLLGGYVAFSF